MASSRVDLDAVQRETESIYKQLLSRIEKTKPQFKKLLHLYFEHELDANKICVIYDFGGPSRSFTYAEVDKLASRVKSSLFAATDLRGFIGVLHHKNQFFPSIQLGILRTGCAVLNLGSDQDWTTRAERGRSLLGMKFVLVGGALFSQFHQWFQVNAVRTTLIRFGNEKLPPREEASFKLLYLVELFPRDGVFYDDRFLQPFRFAYAVETSGSTGDKKFVLVPHKCITPNIHDLISRVWKLNSNDVLWGSSPSTFDPSVCDLFCALGSGGTIVYTADDIRHDGNLLGRVFMKHKVSVIQTTPSTLRKISAGLNEVHFFEHQISTLAVLALGGEKCLSKSELRGLLSLEMFNSLRTLVNLYGLTEMSCWASFGVINPYNNEPVCSGEGMLETEIRTDMFTGPTAREVPGYSQVVIKSSTRICTVIDQDGYIIQEDPKIASSNAVIKMGNLEISTEDLAILHDSFHLGVEVVGRLDTIVKRSGMKIPLCLIEDMAMATGHLNFAQGVEHNGKIYLIVIPKKQESSILGLGAEIRASFFPSLKLDIHPEFYPNCVVAVHTIPLTTNGKLDVREIVEVASIQNYRWPGVYNIDEDTVTHVLHPLWLIATERPANVHLANIAKENFYQAGGTSVLGMWLLEAFFNCLGLYGSPLFGTLQDTIFKKLSVTTFAGICHYLTKEVEKQPKTAQVAIVSAEMVTSHTMNTTAIDIAQDYWDFPWGPGPDEVDYDSVFDAIEQARLNDPSAPSNFVITHPVKVVRVFEYNMNVCIDATAVMSTSGIAEDVAFVGSHSGSIIAVDTQELRRLVRLGERCPSTLAVAWTCYIPGRVETEAIISNEGSYAYLGCCNGNVLKIAIVDGKVEASYICTGSIRSKVALNADCSKLVVMDCDNIISCLDTMNLRTIWTKRIGARSSSFPPVIEENTVLVTTAIGGVTAHSISLGGHQKWPSLREKENGATTSPAIWKTARGTLAVYGLPDGLEVRGCHNGELLKQVQDCNATYTWFEPVVHNCQVSNFSEVILTDTKGQVMRVSFMDGNIVVRRQKLKNPLIGPTVLCTSNDNVDPTDENKVSTKSESGATANPAQKCYLLSRPSDSNTFMLYGLNTTSYEAQEEVLYPVRSDEKNFSKSVCYKDMLIFGGRDDKLHVIFCKSARQS